MDGVNAMNDNAVYVVAEIGVNHNGSRQVAQRLVSAAARAKVTAVKFQLWRTEDLIHSSNPDWPEYKKLELPRDDYISLAEQARQAGLQVGVTPVTARDAKWVIAHLAPDFIKIPSCEINNVGYLEKIASMWRGLTVMSTGMAHEDEIRDAVACFKTSACSELVLLHCIASYPPDPENAQLGCIPGFKEKFHCPVGFSDHHPFILYSLAAVALGACMIEKHLTLEKHQPAFPEADHDASITEKEFRRLVRDAGKIAAARTTQRFLDDKERMAGVAMRRSPVAVRAIAAGRRIHPDDFRLLRPATGMTPVEAESLPGKYAVRPISIGETISLADVQETA